MTIHSDHRRFNAEMVLYATDRVPNSAGLGLESIGMELNGNGAIKVIAQYQTNVPFIYALGDVTDRCNLTPEPQPKRWRWLTSSMGSI